MRLEAADLVHLDGALKHLIHANSGVESPDTLKYLYGLGQHLPERFIECLWELRVGLGPAYLIVKRPELAEVISETPQHWRTRPREGTLLHDYWLLTVMSHLGDAVSWTTLQDGRLLNDVIPIESSAEAQTGHGSAMDLDFHVEDAFDELRCDSLGLLCLRNDQGVATTVASVEDVAITDADRSVLAQPRFGVVADTEHLAQCPSLDKRLTAVFADDGVCLDPAYMAAAAYDSEAAGALARLTTAVQASLLDVVLRPGELLLIDNRRAVHGRRSFQPRYDGTDRWLRKATVVRDLRRSRGRRTSAQSRAVAPIGLGGSPAGVDT